MKLLRLQIGIFIFLFCLNIPYQVKATTTTDIQTTTLSTIISSTGPITTSDTTSVTVSTTTLTTTSKKEEGVNIVILLNTSYKLCDNDDDYANYKLTNSTSMTNSSCNEFCANRGNLFSGTMNE